MLKAPTEFNAICHAMMSRYCPLGYDTSPDYVSTYQTLVSEIHHRGRFTVNTANSENTIFSEPEFIWDFRAWHDATHYAIHAEFNLIGETLVAIRQVADLATVYGVATAKKYRALIFAEVIGQALHYECNGEFPADQMAFDADFLYALRCYTDMVNA